MQLSPRSLALLATITPAVFGAPVGDANSSPPPSALAPPYLNSIAQSKGKLWFGTAADIPGTAEISDKSYMTILNDTRIFGEITPANAMKFEPSEPQQGVYNFTGGDEVVRLARDHGKYVRCHNLIWQSQLPDWVNNGQWTNSTLTAAMKEHIYGMVQHFGGDCYSWDVVNEALAEDGTFANNIWLQHIGSAYVALAFQFAGEAVSKVGKPIKLYYNDYNIESPGAKQAGAVAMVKDLQSRKIPIDGVGLESHFIVGETPSKASQVAAMQSYTNLGVDVVVTELDVRFQNVTTDATKTGYLKQATDYYNTVSACMSVSRCRGVTVWDFVDTYSWIPSTFAGQGEADLYSSDYSRKAAFQACGEALQGVACSMCK